MLLLSFLKTMMISINKLPQRKTIVWEIKFCCKEQEQSQSVHLLQIQEQPSNAQRAPSSKRFLIRSTRSQSTRSLTLQRLSSSKSSKRCSLIQKDQERSKKNLPQHLVSSSSSSSIWANKEDVKETVSKTALLSQTWKKSTMRVVRLETMPHKIQRVSSSVQTSTIPQKVILCEYFLFNVRHHATCANFV